MAVAPICRLLDSIGSRRLSAVGVRVVARLALIDGHLVADRPHIQLWQKDDALVAPLGKLLSYIDGHLGRDVFARFLRVRLKRAI